MNKAADDAQGHSEVFTFETALQQHGWKTGDNVQIDYRWGAGDLSSDEQFSARQQASSAFSPS